MQIDPQLTILQDDKVEVVIMTEEKGDECCILEAVAAAACSQ